VGPSLESPARHGRRLGLVVCRAVFDRAAGDGIMVAVGLAGINFATSIIGG